MGIICILNPTAGRGRAKKKWEACRQVLETNGIKVQTITTSGFGDAADFARSAVKNGVETIIVAGGDGTVNEVIGAVAESEVKVAIAPFGTGNDLARGLQIPLDEKEWTNLFPAYRVQKVDLGVVNGRYFANQVGLGFDAQVAHKVNSRDGLLAGKLAYLAAIVSCLKEFKGVEVEIEFDGKTLYKKVMLASFANSPFAGGGLMMVPTAEPTDGCLDLFILEEISRIELIKSFHLILKGKHALHPAVKFYRSSSFSLRSSEEQYIHIDGETQKAKNLDIVIKPNSINLLVP